MESAKDYAIFMLDPQGHVASWNAGAERIKGYTADEIIGQHFSKFYPPGGARPWLARPRTEGRRRRGAVRGRGLAGPQGRLAVLGQRRHHGAARTSTADLRGFSKITRDMTARKQAEENARRLAEEAGRRRPRRTPGSSGSSGSGCGSRWRASATPSSAPTPRAGSTFLNPVAEELVGWKPGEAAGQAARRRVPHRQRADPPAGREPGREGAAGGRRRRAGEPHRPDRQGRGGAAHRRQRRPDPGRGGDG